MKEKRCKRNGGPHAAVQMPQKKVGQLGRCPLPQPHSSVHSVCGPKGGGFKHALNPPPCACFLPIAVE